MRHATVWLGVAWVLIGASAVRAQGGPIEPPPTPGDEKFTRARERLSLEIEALKARQVLAGVELMRLDAERGRDRVKARARELGYPEVAATLEGAKPEPLDGVTIAILDVLDRPLSMPFDAPTPLEDVIKYVKSGTQSSALPEGIPIYVDPVGLQKAKKSESSPVKLNLEGVSLKRSLKLALGQLGLMYRVKDGLLTIGTEGCFDGEDERTEERRKASGGPDPAVSALDRVAPIDVPAASPLVEALERIGASANVVIVVEPRAAGMVAAATVGFRAVDLPLKFSLERILGPLGLGYTTRRAMIVVVKAAPKPPVAAPAAGGIRPEVNPAEPPK